VKKLPCFVTSKLPGQRLFIHKFVDICHPSYVDFWGKITIEEEGYIPKFNFFLI
jgi:hypothetical protein